MCGGGPTGRTKSERILAADYMILVSLIRLRNALFVITVYLSREDVIIRPIFSIVFVTFCSRM